MIARIALVAAVASEGLAFYTVAEWFAAGYQDELSPLGRGLGDVAPFVVMILILLWRPTGLLGSKELTRV